MAVTDTIKVFAALGIGAFILFVLFGSINYVKSELSSSGVNLTAPQTLENSINTAGNFSGIGLILLAVVALISVVASLLYIFRQ